MSAKSLNQVDRLIMIVTGMSLQATGRVAERRFRSVHREAEQAARSLASSPEHYKPRKKEVDVEGERVTCREASIVKFAIGESLSIPPGSVAVACLHRNARELGRPLSFPLGDGLSTERRSPFKLSGVRSVHSAPRRQGRSHGEGTDCRVNRAQHSRATGKASPDRKRVPRPARTDRKGEAGFWIQVPFVVS